MRGDHFRDQGEGGWDDDCRGDAPDYPQDDGNFQGRGDDDGQSIDREEDQGEQQQLPALHAVGEVAQQRRGDRIGERVAGDQPGGAAGENGDTVVIDFEGFLGDEAFEGGKGENYSLELGSNSFIPGFEDQLVGKKAGEEVEVNVTFPEDYQAEDLAGKEAVFKVTVHEVKAKELPELDDEFAKDVDDSVESLDELKEKFRKELTEAKEAAAEEAKDEEAIRLAVENAEIVELPHVMVHDEVHRSMDEFLNNMQRQGISPEMYYQLTGSTEEDLHKQFEGEAETRTKTNLVIEAVAKAENIEVTQEDIDAEVKDLAEQYNMPEAQVRKVLNNDMLEHDIRMKRAVETITETAVEK